MVAGLAVTSLLITVALAGEVIFSADGRFKDYPEGRFNRRDSGVGGALGYSPNGDYFYAGKDCVPCRVFARQSLNDFPIPGGSYIHGVFWFYLDVNSPLIATDDAIHLIGNVNYTKLVKICVIQPGELVGGTIRNRLKVETTAGASFTSNGAYDLDVGGPYGDGWHKIEYYIYVADGTRGKIKLLVDGNDEGSASGIDTRQGYDWNSISYGVAAGHRKPMDYCFDNILLEYCEPF